MQKYHFNCVAIILLVTYIYGNIVTALTEEGNYKHLEIIFKFMLISMHTQTTRNLIH
jgi:hypothetical protein